MHLHILPDQQERSVPYDPLYGMAFTRYYDITQHLVQEQEQKVWLNKWKLHYFAIRTYQEYHRDLIKSFKIPSYILNSIKDTEIIIMTIINRLCFFSFIKNRKVLE